MKTIVGIVGFGTMGRGIARILLKNGYKLVISDIDSDTTKRLMVEFSSELNKRVQRGKISEEEMNIMMDNIGTTFDGATFSDVRFLVEAVNEDMRSKSEMMRLTEPLIPRDAIILTNTSSLSVQEISLCLQYSDRFAGMHFFNPPEVLPLVEVIPGPLTSDETLESILSFAETIGKTPLVVSDTPGFVVNRVLFPMILEAMRLMDHTGMTAENIDLAMTQGARLPMGPFRLSDFIGNDVVLDICSSIHSATGEPQFIPPEILKNLVSNGKIGLKTKSGFYEYD